VATQSRRLKPIIRSLLGFHAEATARRKLLGIAIIMAPPVAAAKYQG
jgi:hypothetical protein